MTSTLPEITITAPNRFEEELQHITREQRNDIVAVLRTFMEEIRELLEEAKQMPGDQCGTVKPECATCAFNRKTDSWEGFTATAYGLAWAFAQGKLFMCHSNQPGHIDNKIDISKLVLCEGFTTLHTRKFEQAHAIASEAMATIQRIAPK